jgi:hypothetical protein
MYINPYVKMINMIKLGIKISDEPTSFKHIQQINPSMCEVWFNASKSDNYINMFDFLKGKNIDIGLHFWGYLQDGTLANIAYPKSSDLKNTLNLMKLTINIAQKHGFQYVNIHPGSSARVSIDTKFEEFTVIEKPISIKKSLEVFMENVIVLHEYAKKREVLLTVETVPIRVTNGYKNPDPRIKTKNIYELPIDALYLAKDLGISVANDFGHTASQCITSSNNLVRQYLKGTTKKLLPATKLIHAGFIIPPYNGTDFHDSFENPLFETSDAIPNKQLFIELIKLFHNQKNVWMLAEPHGKHVENYVYVKNLLTKENIQFM